MRSTHTYVVLEISQDAYDEIRAKLRAADYHHAFMDDGEIDMHGIAINAPIAEAPIGQLSEKQQIQEIYKLMVEYRDRLYKVEEYIKNAAYESGNSRGNEGRSHPDHHLGGHTPAS